MNLSQYNDPFHVDVWSYGGSVVTVAGATDSATVPTNIMPASAPNLPLNPLMLLLAAVAVVTIIVTID